MFSPKNKRIWSLIMTVVLAINLAITSGADAYQLNSKQQSEENITTGVVLKTINLNTSDGVINAYILQLDLTNKYLKLDSIVGQDNTLSKTQNVTDMANRTGAVAAVNGGFFQMNVGKPIGITVSDEQLIASPAMRSDMPGIGITAEKEVFMGLFGFSGSVTAENGQQYPLFGINKPDYLVQTGQSADLENILLYDSNWGAMSRGASETYQNVVEVVVENDRVKSMHQDSQPVSIPKEGYVLRGQGTAAQFMLDNFEVGSEVEVEYEVTPDEEEFVAAVGGNTMLVEEGQVAQFTQTVGGKVARTAAGISQDGETLYFVAVEGGASRGMTQPEFAEFLINELDVYTAVNLDGGGSTTLAARHLGDFNASVVNTPQKTVQRRVPDALAIYSTAPAGRLEGLLVKAPQVILADTEATVKVTGYDQYFNPYEVNQEKVKWSVEPANGNISDGIFKASSGGTITITATYDGETQSTKIKVIGANDIKELKLTPSSIEVEPGKTVNLSLQVITKDGATYPLENRYINWDVDNKLGTVANGTFTAGTQPGSGEIAVEYQGIKGSIPVVVRDNNSQLVPVAAGKIIDIMPEPGLELRFPDRLVSESVDLNVAIGKATPVLPEQYKMLKNLSVLPINLEIKAKGFWQLKYRLDAENEMGRAVVLRYDQQANAWQEQPYWMQEIDDEKNQYIKANITDFGDVVVAIDNKPQPLYPDTKNLWPGAEEIISDMAARGIIQGFLDGSFKPGESVTRAQFVTMMSRAFKWQKPEKAPIFKDQLPDWGKDAIAAAVAKGVVTGYDDGSFRPHQPITRAQMATMMVRALNIQETGSKLTYKDAGQVPAIFQTYVSAATDAGLLQGQNGLFRPQDSATRAETAVVISRMLSYWVQQ